MAHSTNHVQVLGSVFKMLGRYMDAERIDNPALRESITAAEQQPRVAIEMWWETLEQLYALVPETALGIKIGRYIEVQDAGVLGFLASSSNTLAEAAMRFQRFQAILHNLSYSWIKTDADSVVFGWEGNGNQSTVLSNDVFISSLITLLSKLTEGGSITPNKVVLWNVKQNDLATYKAQLACEVVSSPDEISIAFPLAIAQRKINSSNPDLLKIVEQQAESILATLPAPDSFLQLSQQLINKHLDTGVVNARWLAGQLNLSERSLHRKLQERGHSYQRLLDDLRQQLAVRYLKDSQLGITDISLMLGYSEQSAFTRAFKKWTEQTPMRYRKMHNSNNAL
tara:strand:+ start:332 stop:1348 length:1017 start_codon:yes stop_codon:yes gene_type:complete